MRTYRKAPIVEAVLDLQFDKPVAVKDLERAAARFHADYPQRQERYEIEVVVAEGAVKQTPQLIGYQLNAKNGQDALLLQRKNFTTVRLAPYDGWEVLYRRATSSYERLLTVIPRPVISRVGARYINRFDIPNDGLNAQPLSKYFKIQILIGDVGVKLLRGFNHRVDFVEATTGTTCGVNFAVVPPALLAHQSFTLDIDVYKVGDIPLRIEEMWSAFNVLHEAKNAIFEGSITDEMRELIS